MVLPTLFITEEMLDFYNNLSDFRVLHNGINTFKNDLAI